MLHSGRRRSLLTTAVSTLLTIIAALSAVIITVGLLARARSVPEAVTERLTPFWSALPGSMILALAAGSAATMLAVALNPGADGIRRTEVHRLAALIIAACVPAVVLVLGATLVAAVFPAWTLVASFQILAVYPALSLLVWLAIELDLRSVARASFEHELRFTSRLTLLANVATSRAAAITLMGAMIVFQNYLVNLCLRPEPSRDALVALSALSPHTGTDWAAVLAGSGILWTCCAGTAILVATANRRALDGR